MDLLFLKKEANTLTVKEHWHNQNEYPLPPLHGLLIPIGSKVSFIGSTPQTSYSNKYNGLWYTSCGALARMRTSSRGQVYNRRKPAYRMTLVRARVRWAPGSDWGCCGPPPAPQTPAQCPPSPPPPGAAPRTSSSSERYSLCLWGDPWVVIHMHPSPSPRHRHGTCKMKVVFNG